MLLSRRYAFALALLGVSVVVACGEAFSSSSDVGGGPGQTTSSTSSSSGTGTSSTTSGSSTSVTGTTTTATGGDCQTGGGVSVPNPGCDTGSGGGGANDSNPCGWLTPTPDPAIAGQPLQVEYCDTRDCGLGVSSSAGAGAAEVTGTVLCEDCFRWTVEGFEAGPITLSLCCDGVPVETCQVTALAAMD